LVTSTEFAAHALLREAFLVVHGALQQSHAANDDGLGVKEQEALAAAQAAAQAEMDALNAAANKTPVSAETRQPLMLFWRGE
jgi:hypothetical protein